MEVNKIYNENCIDGMKKIPDGYVDMIITSPPYYNLRDYGELNQIGQESSVDEYLNNLLLVFDETRRILKDTGSCWINISDVYDKQSLLCIPDRLKIKMVERGWICRNEIIWHKPNAMPSSAKNRFNNDYEKMLFFTKKRKYFFETQYEPLKSFQPKGGVKNHKSTKYENVEQEAAVRQGMNKKRGTKLIYLRKKLPEQQIFVNFMRSKTTIDAIVENSELKRSKVEH